MVGAQHGAGVIGSMAHQVLQEWRRLTEALARRRRAELRNGRLDAVSSRVTSRRAATAVHGQEPTGSRRSRPSSEHRHLVESRTPVALTQAAARGGSSSSRRRTASSPAAMAVRRRRATSSEGTGAGDEVALLQRRTTAAACWDEGAGQRAAECQSSWGHRRCARHPARKGSQPLLCWQKLLSRGPAPKLGDPPSPRRRVDLDAVRQPSAVKRSRHRE
jgi:hypothetical protein